MQFIVLPGSLHSPSDELQLHFRPPVNACQEFNIHSTNNYVVPVFANFLFGNFSTTRGFLLPILKRTLPGLCLSSLDFYCDKYIGLLKLVRLATPGMEAFYLY